VIYVAVSSGNFNTQVNWFVLNTEIKSSSQAEGKWRKSFTNRIFDNYIPLEDWSSKLYWMSLVRVVGKSTRSSQRVARIGSSKLDQTRKIGLSKFD
jgi:hypothetical protein